MIYYSDILPSDRLRVAILFRKDKPADGLEFADYLDQHDIPWTAVEILDFSGEFISIPVWQFRRMTKHALRFAIEDLLYIDRDPSRYREYGGLQFLMRPGLNEWDMQEHYENKYLTNLLLETDIIKSIDFLPPTAMVMEELFFGRAAGLFDYKEGVLDAVNNKISEFMCKYGNVFRGRHLKILY